MSLAPLLRGGNTIDRSALYWHYNQHPHSAPVSIIRRGDWKLIEFLETEDVELYDLSKDPSETNNLADDKADRARKMQAELGVWRKEVGADPMLPNPDFQGAR